MTIAKDNSQPGGQNLLVKMVNYLTHESRNALQRSQAALEQLRRRLVDQPDVLQLVIQAENAQNDLLRLYETARAYVLPMQLNCDVYCLGEIWWQVWSKITANCWKRVELQEDLNKLDLRCEVDRSQMAQVFQYFLENSINSCPSPVQLSLSVQSMELQGKPAIQLTLRDNGSEPEQQGREHFFDPFHSTRPRRNKLSLALARNIIEAHQGCLFLGAGPGLTLIMQLPRRRS